jgi:hypothetical protein
MPDTKIKLGFGLQPPEDVTTAWGARLIAPADLLWDRQDLKTDSDEAKTALIAWLNGTPSGTGAIAKMQEALNGMGRYAMPDGDEFIPYEDETGKIIANTNRSGGYVYVAGWLK